tara:strand:+ start:351 stop:1019 length:669 start_codon:yes stop_codon:yes gene_type:complete
MKIQRQSASLRFQVQEALREEIVSGRLKPGERLVESQLCEEMDVSRTSLRESLRGLEAEGLVSLVPHRGAVVASIEISDAKQIYQVRGVIEALAVRNFVDYASDTDFYQLEKAFKFIEATVASSNNVSELLKAKREFYDVLLCIDENSVVRGILDMLNNRISLLRSLSLAQPSRLEKMIEEIDLMMKMIKRRDSEKAAEATLLHIKNAAVNVVLMLEKNKDF